MALELTPIRTPDQDKDKDDENQQQTQSQSQPQLTQQEALSTDPQNLLAQAQAQFKRIERRRANLFNTMQSVTKTIDRTRQEHLKTLDIIGQRQEVIANQAETALENLRSIRQLPSGIANLIGFFDEDFSAGVQRTELQKAELQLDKLNRQAQIAQQTREAKLGAAKQKLQVATDLYQFDRQGFLDTANLARMGFEIKKQVRKDLVNKVQDMSFEQLNDMVNGKKSIPKELRGREGLIEAEFFNKKARKLNVNSTEIAVLNNSLLLEERRENLALSGLSDEQLEEFSKMNSEQLPDPFTPGGIRKENLRRREGEIALRKASALSRAQELELANIEKQKFFETLREPELDQLIEQAKQSGGAVPLADTGLTATLAELDQAAQAASERRTAREKRQMDLALRNAAVGTEFNAINEQLFNMSSLVTEGTSEDPTAGLPIDLKAEWESTMAKLEAAQSLPDGGAAATVELISNLKKTVNEATTKFIEQQPESSKTAATEFINHGRVVTQQAAAEHLTDAGLNRGALAHDPVLNPVFRQFSDQLRELAGQKRQSIDLREGDLTLTKLDDPAATQMVQEAIDGSVVKDGRNIKDMFQRASLQLLMTNAITSLQQKSPESQSIWQGIVNPDTGNFNNAIMQRLPDGSTRFNMDNLQVLLAAKTVQLQQQGVLEADETLNDRLFDHMESTISSKGFDENFISGNLTAAALYRAVANNRASTILSPTIRALRGNIDQAMERAREEVSLRQNRAAQESQLLSPEQRREQTIQNPLLHPGFSPNPNLLLGQPRQRSQSSDPLQRQLDQLFR